MTSTKAMWIVAALALVQPLSLAQSFIPLPRDVTVQQSSVLPGASISFKEETSSMLTWPHTFKTDICDTTPGVQSYSGYVTLPSEDGTYNASIFFWYFTARSSSDSDSNGGTAANNTAPTTLWIPGGPASSFLDGSSGFPCSVDAGGNSTTLNPWALNGRSNMLYVDVPTQTGYSYADARNGSFDVVADLFTPQADGTGAADAVGVDGSASTTTTTTVASMSSQEGSRTLNTTQQVARQVWQFSQVWFQEFPEWKTSNKEINLWSFSYSGFFGSASAAYIQKQNDRLANGTYETTGRIAAPIALPLGTLGLNNGCVDIESQISYYPSMMVNNTYGIKVVPDEVYLEARALADACYGPIAECRAAAAELDPEGTGAVAEVNALCVNVTETCFLGLTEIYLSSNRTQFDLNLAMPGVWPPFGQPAAFYNQRWVQEALGVPVNFTLSSNTVVENMLIGTGDPIRPTYETLEYILNAGVGLAFVYGDRDFDCSWMSVENVSLHLDYPEAPSFRSAGYAALQTNASYQGGLVRQHDRVSFSRVFEAGHDVAAYQPETVLRIFERAILGRDVATGEVDVLSLLDTATNDTAAAAAAGGVDATSDHKSCDGKSKSKTKAQKAGGGGGYSTEGPLSVLNVTNAVLAPVMSEPRCWWYTVNNTQSCTEEQIVAVAQGTAVVEDWVVVSPPGVFYATSASPASAAAATGAGALVK